MSRNTRSCCLLNSHIWHPSLSCWHGTALWCDMAHKTPSAPAVTQVAKILQWSHISQALTGFLFLSPIKANKCSPDSRPPRVNLTRTCPQLSSALRQFLVSWLARRVVQTRPCLQSSDPNPNPNRNPSESLSMCLSACALRPINLSWFLQSSFSSFLVFVFFFFVRTRFLRSHKSTPVRF